MTDIGYRGRNLAMDGIRGLAVLIVFLSHTSGRGQALAPYLQFHGIGHVGVYLFFVLSGFLLADNLLHEYEKYGDVSIRNFLMRRFLRIAPLYYCVVSAVFTYQIVSGQVQQSYLHIDKGWEGYIQHLLFWRGDSVFWTIPAEFTFYFILPWIVLGLIKYGRKAFLLCVGLLIFYAIWYQLIVFQRVPPERALRIVQIAHYSQYLDVFLCGVLTAFCKRLQFVRNVFANYSREINQLALIVLLTTIFITCAAVAHKFFDFDRPFYGLRWLTLIYGVIFAFVILVAQAPGVITSIFNQIWLRYLGIVGFSWYLVHMFIIQQVNHLSLSPPLLFVLSTASCALLASVLFILIEKPFMELGKRITARATPASAQALKSSL